MVTLVNRAKVATSTTGTGTITLGAAESGYQTFADAGVSDADVVRYVIEDGTAWEIGTGTYTATGTTLSRTVLESSNADAALNLTGSAVVYVSATAEDIPAVQELYAENPSSPTAPSATGTNAIAIGTNAQATNTNAVALTRNAVASGISSFAFGNNAAATGTSGVAIGSGTGAAERATAIGGAGAQALQQNTTAIGSNSSSQPSTCPAGGGAGAMALGGSYASGTDSFAAAIANNSSSYGATGANSVAMGQQAKATQSAAFGLGVFSSATGTNAVAIGYTATATGNYSTAVGRSRSTGGDSFSAAIGSTSTSYGSSNSNSVALGANAKASGLGSFAAGGTDAQATGTRSVAIGGAFPVASGAYTIALGWASVPQDRKMGYSQLRFTTSGDAQLGTVVLAASTTDATPTVLSSDNFTSSNIIILPNNSAYAFHGTIVARQQASQGTACAAWKIEGLIRREGSAGTTVLVNSATTVLDNTPSWGMALSADTTNGGLKIEVTGAASTNIRFVSTIHTSEVTY